MVILRVAEGIRSHFPARVSEWALAGMLVHWGRIVGRPSEVFANSPALQHLTAMAGEPTWGMAAQVVGGLRLLALIINGTFADTRYGRVSPHVRGVTAFLSCFVWLQISLGLLGSGAETTGLAIYPWLLALDIFNTARAFGDAGDMARAKKYAGT